MRKAGVMLIMLLIFTLAAGRSFSENLNIRTQSRVDWGKGVLLLDMTVPLDMEGTLFPKARLEAEERIEATRSALFLDACGALVLRSSATIAEFLGGNAPGGERLPYLAALSEISRKGRKVFNAVSSDFKFLNVVYEYPFYGPDGIFTPLVRHEEPFPLPALVGYHATQRFSGLVIDARGEYEAFGKKTRARCVPALLPRLYYLSTRGTLELVLEAAMVEPAALRKGGLLAYARSVESEAYALRAGSLPLAVSAFALYGNRDTDIVISEDAARMLLSREENRNLLRQGRIVVLID